MTGCSSGGEGVTGDKEIVFQVAGEAEEVAVYDTLISAYQKDNPGTLVKLVHVADKDDHLQKLATSFAAGDPPDVFLINFREYAQFVTRGAIEPAGPLMQERGVALSDYFEQPLEAFTLDEELQCMPQNISSLVVYYNKRLFRDAGLAPPQPGWSFEDMRSAAKALTSGDVRGLGIEPSVIRIAPFVWSSGGEVVDDLESPSRFTLDTPEARRAVQSLIDLVRVDGVVPTEEEVAAQDLETRFAAGKLGMFLSSRRDTPVFREVTELKWDVAGLPVISEPATILHSDAYCVSRGTENLGASADFIAYATGRQGQSITALAGRTVPSLKEVANSGAFLDPLRPPQHSEVFLEGIEYMRRTPVLSTWSEIEDIAEEIFTRAFYEDGYTLDDALRDLEDQANPLFEEASAL
ncbi:MAG: sugar ABC transporter substrate-binding protein [Actinobacteria bacterium]|nr:sugar ABC transporter substrate-binding protein [Actinomycetota bacterium]